MITVQHPHAFFLLLILVPVTGYMIYRFKKLSRYLGKMYLKNSSGENRTYRSLKSSIMIRTVLRVLGFISAVFALAGISWGTRTVPVQKSGDAVSLVFDISYSMMAEDSFDGLSRLEAARQYAWELLDRMEGISVSVVLAKGDGVIAVPLTDDRSAVNSIIESLSPSLMTSAGSSIGKGIIAAMQSFPQNMSQSSHIWVFTDGDETDTGLTPALDDAARFGFPVTMVGFGTATPVEITAGDGKTKVKTFLNAEKMIDAAANSSKKAMFPNRSGIRKNLINYVAADSEGSAWVLLHQLSDKKIAGEAYDLQTVPRHALFILLTLVFFVASYFASEFDLSHIIKFHSSTVMLVLMCSLMFISCRSGKESVLAGTFSWYQKKYQSATADFLRANFDAQASMDKVLAEYTAYDLAATYIMQEEYDAALSRLEQIGSDADGKLKSAAFYNAGIIASRRGDFNLAEDYFKKAVLADADNINAKINLEFTHQQVQSRQSQSAEKEMTSVSIDKGEESLANAVFTLIQQEEQERWKNMQSNKKESSAVDY